MRLVAYTRVSRVGDRDGDSFISPTIQRETILRYASAHSHEVVAWLDELDVSGGRDVRPKLEAAFGYVERSEADGIIVARLDRFSRSTAGALRLIERLEAAGGSLVSVDLGLDPSTPMGEFARTVVLALARLEYRRIGEGWKAARAKAVERGVVIANAPVPGYLRDEDGRLELDPTQAPAIAKAFESRAHGDSLGEIAAFLDRAAPRPNGRRWTLRTVRDLLGRRVYLGEAYSGGVVAEGAHEALVDAETFEAVQSLWQNREPRRHSRALLASFVFCSGCGNRMVRSWSGKTYVYRCRRRSSTGICSAPATAGGPKLETWVEGQVRDKLGSELARASLGEDVTEREAAQEALAGAEAELEAWRSSALVSVIGPDEYAAGLTARIAAVDEARARLDALAPAVPLEAIEFLGQPFLGDLSPRHLRAALRRFDGRITVERGRPATFGIVWDRR